LLANVSNAFVPLFFYSKGFIMNRSILISALFAALSLAACDKPTIVNVPAPAVVPGPAGPAGEPGVQGNTGNQGETGETGESTTVIITPPAEAAN
jgi:hypothetical protein